MTQEKVEWRGNDREALTALRDLELPDIGAGHFGRMPEGDAYATQAWDAWRDKFDLTPERGRIISRTYVGRELRRLGMLARGAGCLRDEWHDECEHAWDPIGPGNLEAQA